MTNSLKLYNMWISSCSFRVRIALHLKKLDFDYIPINLFKNEHQTHENLTGTKLVPQLDDLTQNVSLSQSMAILQYLDNLPETQNLTDSRQSPKIFPQDPVQNAKIFEISEIHNSFIQPLQNLSVLRYLEAELGEKFNKLEYCQKFCLQGLQGTENLLDDTSKFCVGDEISAADLFVYPMVVNCLTRHQITLEKFPRLKRVMDNLKTVDEIVQAHPKNQVDTPKNYDFSKWEY